MYRVDETWSTGMVFYALGRRRFENVMRKIVKGFPDGPFVFRWHVAFEQRSVIRLIPRIVVKDKIRYQNDGSTLN